MTRGRRILTRVLAAVGAVLMLLGAVAGWADRTLFDADAFGARARVALEDETVRTVVARTLVRSVVERANPDLIAARPLLESAAATVVATPAFLNLFEGAARETARVLVEDPANNVVLRSNDAVLLLIDTIREYAPQIADQIPESIDAALVRVQDVSAELEIWKLASTVQELAWILPFAALLVWAIAFLVSTDRRRTVQTVGVATATAGFVTLVALRVGEAIVGNAIDDPVTRDAARAAWTTFTEGLGTLGWFGIGIGLLLAAAAFAARPTASRLDPRRIRDQLGALLRHDPDHTLGEILRWVGVAVLGVLLVADPLRVAEVVLIAAGLLLVYGALVGIFELLARPDDTVTDPAGDADASVRRRPVLVVAVVLGVVLAAVIVVTLVDESPEPQAVTIGCNGRLDLCDRPLDEVVIPTSHNANAAADDGYIGANQTDGIGPQLARGVRGLQIDAFLGTRQGGRVFTDFTDVNIENLKANLGADLADRAERARQIIGPPPDTARQDLYLCHGFCELGATKASDAFDTIATFLRRHPRDVLLVIIEDYAPVEALEDGLSRAGLADQRFELDPTEEPLPTLSEIIRSGKRLLVMLENQDGGPAMPNAYDDGIVQETPFTFSNVAALEDPDTCGPERGLSTAPLFLLNHWVTPPAFRATERVNAFEFLDERARRCAEERDLLPNLVAVDFTTVGDLFGVTDALNDDQPSGDVP